MEPEAFIALVVVTGGLVGLLSLSWTPLGRALVERLRARRLPDVEAFRQEELQAELLELRERVAELEQRQDFTERLLTKQREGQRLAPPG